MTDKERRKVTEWFKSRAKNCPMPATRQMYEIAIKALEQEPKTGHWIKSNEHYRCSECSLTTSESGKNFYRYCPNCGSKNKDNLARKEQK